jgi:hypothetical protein
MNDPHKFGTEFESDHALEQSTPIVSHHDTIKWFEAIPGKQPTLDRYGSRAHRRAITATVAETTMTRSSDLAIFPFI